MPANSHRRRQRIFSESTLKRQTLGSLAYDLVLITGRVFLGLGAAFLVAADLGMSLHVLESLNPLIDWGVSTEKTGYTVFTQRVSEKEVCSCSILST